MATNNPLLVPINVEAFVVNQATYDGIDVNIQRWQYAYPFLNLYASPQPRPFTAGNQFPGTGVLLHWELPQILREGQQGSTGSVDFPLVPNRWLIVRYSGPLHARIAAAWVVQSDALGNSDPRTGGAPYLQPGATTIQPTWIGSAVALSNWTEPNPPRLFLTSVAPGNNMFAAFQPYCQNVFSMYDPLDGVANEDTLSYFVAGWYSKQDKDITGSWKRNDSTFKAFLDQARWKLAAESEDDATWALYHSMVWGVHWNLGGPSQSNVPKGSDIKTAIGNTAVDALTAMIASQAGGDPLIDAGLLEALQYGLLPIYDQPDAEYELASRIEQAWFGSRTGGYGWEIVSRPVDASQGDPPPPPSPEELAKEAQWLAELNTAQSQFDTLVSQLADQQWNLYQVWWKYNNAQANGLTEPYPDGTTAAQFQSALDPSNSQSLVSQVNALQRQIQTLSTQIPTGATQELLQTAINRYAQSKQLPSTRELKQYATRPFSRAYEPVFLMQGLKVDAPLAPISPRTVRFTGQEVTGFRYQNQDITLGQVQSVIPVPANMSAVPAQLIGLLYEFFLLDPTNATMIARAALGSSDPAVIAQVAAAMAGGRNVLSGNVTPDVALACWAQTWSPLVLLWDIVWYPIPHDSGGAPFWNFNGREYEWSGEGFDPAAPAWEYHGMIFLTPQASFNFRAQVLKFIQENPSYENVKALYDFVDSIDGWDFLSQSLVGLSQMMTLRDATPNVSSSLDPQVYFQPNTTLAKLTGPSATYVPLPGQPYPRPFQPWPPSGFQNWRAGQFVVRRLYVVDRFGQTVEIVNSQTQSFFKPSISPNLTPGRPVLPQDPDAFIQLPPRLLQPGRLSLDYVACDNDDHILGYEPDVNPICAWLLHSYFNESIVAYSNDGVILGQLWLITNDRLQQVVYWQAAPDSPYLTLQDLLQNPHLAHLGQTLLAIQQLGPTAFQSFLAAIDEASWTIDGEEPNTDIGLALLAGRPVAMARVRLQFQLQGPIVTDPSWRYTFQPATNPAASWPFNIRMGEAGMHRDGLIGYFVGSNYNKFYIPRVPRNVPEQQYLQPIGTGTSLMLPFDGQTAGYVTMLADPRAVVHATTGILPVIEMKIPPQFVGPAFARMEVTFTVGPVLTDSVTPAHAEEGEPLPSILVPRPVLKNGTWSWQQYDGAKWVSFDVAPPVPNARFSNVPARLRSGLLRLTGAISHVHKSHGPTF